jgi:N-acetylmuramoyl-L-alanine amidase
MYEVKNGFLLKDGKLVSYRESANYGRTIKPRIIVIHYTGSNSLEGALSWLASPKSGVSAHLVIAKNGTVYQMVPFDVAAWHAGSSSYEGKSHVNAFSIGIECVGIGDAWPKAQVDAIHDVVAAIGEAYDIEDIVGHSDVAPGRKVDPGPNFPWDAVTSTGEEVVIPPVDALPETISPAPAPAVFVPEPEKPAAPKPQSIIDIILGWFK